MLRVPLFPLQISQFNLLKYGAVKLLEMPLSSGLSWKKIGYSDFAALYPIFPYHGERRQRIIEVLRTGKFNHRLLSELICHKDFQRFMLDTEIYVDRIADMRVNDMNAVLEAVRQMALMKNDGEENDLHLRTLEVAQIREDEYFGSLIADDLKDILRDIRNEHRPDTMTADETTLVATVQGQLQEAMNFEGSSEEKKIRAYLATIGLDYDALTKEEFVSLIGILKKSKYMKNPISQRGKARAQLPHGKGKRKRK